MSDILLIDSDGGAFEYGANNDIRADNTIMSMCYITLFNGDTPLNSLREFNLDNEFEKAISKRMVTKYRQEAEAIGTSKLQWLKSEGAVKNIELSIVQSVESSERFDIKIIGQYNNGVTFSETLTTIKGA